MSSEAVLRVKDIGKRYEIYQSPHHRLWQTLLGGKKRFYREFWALREVAFEVKQGECVGVVGRNGSGKSTLLQIIAGALAPTVGSVEAEGRIAALLELGSGFNRAFTGRENAYMNGVILGVSKAEMDKKIDGIAAFADVGEFFDRPVKTYSSGMSVRLAFAVAISVDPDILIIDEALAVGDEAFQRKCHARIGEMRKRGVTVLFCSHSGNAIVELCDRALLLDAGQKLAQGSPKWIVGQYQKLIYAPPEKRAGIREEIRGFVQGPREPAAKDGGVAPVVTPEPEEWFDPHLKPQSTLEYESHGTRIESAGIFTLTGSRVNHLRRGACYFFRYRVRFDRDATNVRFGMLIKTVSGLELGGSVSAPAPVQGIPHVGSGTAIDVEFRFTCDLNPGAYFLNAGVTGSVEGKETYLHRVLDVCMLKVMPVAGRTSTGVVDFHCEAKWLLCGELREAVSG